MFHDIEAANKQWVEKRETALHDVALLLAKVNGDCARVFNTLIDRVHNLSFADKAYHLKSPAIQRVLGTLIDDVLSFYDHSSEACLRDARDVRLREVVNELDSVFVSDSACRNLPTLGWIRIVSGPVAKQFNAGSEYGVEIATDIDLSSWEAATRGALSLIALSPGSDILVRTFVSYIVPLKQREEVKNLSFSTKELPNVIFKNNEASAMRFGETLVHEADHQFFYALEECQEFWNADPRSQAAAYFSPWRDDSRPLDGILRGLSAFTRVALYYLGLFNIGADQNADTIGPLLMQRIVECKDAASILSQSGELSHAGNVYLRELTGALREVEQGVSAHEDSLRWRVAAEGILNAHREKCRVSRLRNPNEFTRDYL